VFAELVSSCDPTVRLWINAKQLKNRLLWQPGWQPLNTLAPEGEAEQEQEEFFWLN
jgi:hypothetical protein